MLRVEECATLDELVSLRTEWDALLDRADLTTIYSTWEWAEACWRYVLPGRQPLILVARDADGAMVGLLPLARTSRFGLLNMLEVLGCTRLGYPLGDYAGLVAVRGAERDVFLAFLRYLKSARRWSVLDLRNIMAGVPPREEQMSQLLSEAAAQLGWEVSTVEADSCRVLALPSTFDQYLATLSSNTRQNIRRKLRKLQPAGITIEAVDALDEQARTDALETFYKFHRLRWAATGSREGFAHPQVREMHRHLAANLAARGWLDLRLVRSADGQIQGVIYNFRRNGACYFYHIGFNNEEEWSPYSLGFCLLATSIEAAIESGCHTFDFLRGDHEYKRHFSGRTTHNFRVTVYKQSWLPKAIGLARKLKRKTPAHVAPQLGASPVSD
ncbi:MAG TPA: GNAT family N-acetyltransferase [Chloroflexia bacterium]|nr:GNAT family N-acetyltransferase [Chloroflexia bacterium]